MNQEQLTQKWERAERKATTQTYTPASKGERLQKDLMDFLRQVDPSIEEITRQTLKGEKLGKVILSKDVMKIINEKKFQVDWGVIPLDKLVEWAWQNGYRTFEQLREQFELLPLGLGYCTVEIACDPSRQDLIQVLREQGIAGLKASLKESGEQIATDTPGIAEYFFGAELLFTLGGSTEAMPKEFYPVIIGIVSSGSSLKDEGWERVSQSTPEGIPEAILLRSQLMMVVKK